MSHDHSSCCTIQKITSIQDATTMKYQSALVTHRSHGITHRSHGVTHRSHGHVDFWVYSAQLIQYLGKNKQYKMRTFPKYHIFWWISQPFFFKSWKSLQKIHFDLHINQNSRAHLYTGQPENMVYIKSPVMSLRESIS